MTQQNYVEWFGGTAMTRAKRSGLRRNAMIALYASKDPRWKTAADINAADDDIVVRETALQLKAKYQREEGEESAVERT